MGLNSNALRCQWCYKAILVGQEMVVCLHCDAEMDLGCHETNPLCPRCKLPSLRQGEGAKKRESWPCFLCEKNFTLVSGFSFCAACGANFHVNCRGFTGECPGCRKSAPVFVSGEKEHELSPLTRILRRRETLKDCFWAWWFTCAIVWAIYCFLGYLGLEIGYRAIAVLVLGTLWWLYCATLTQFREWP